MGGSRAPFPARSGPAPLMEVGSSDPAPRSPGLGCRREIRSAIRAGFGELRIGRELSGGVVGHHLLDRPVKPFAEVRAHNFMFRHASARGRRSRHQARASISSQGPPRRYSAEALDQTNRISCGFATTARSCPDERLRGPHRLDWRSRWSGRRIRSRHPPA